MREILEVMRTMKTQSMDKEVMNGLVIIMEALVILARDIKDRTAAGDERWDRVWNKLDTIGGNVATDMTSIEKMVQGCQDSMRKLETHVEVIDRTVNAMRTEVRRVV
jgi:hypothetical protein